METSRPGELRRGAAPSAVRDLVRLAWPSVLSFVCNNAYRPIDQFFIQRLGSEAQAAMTPVTFVGVFNFALYFLPVAGAMALVARSVGAGNQPQRDRTIRDALVASVTIALVVGALGLAGSGAIAGLLGLAGRTRELCSEYLATLYAWSLPMALGPLLDNVFFAMGNSRLPLFLQLVSVGGNALLNPILIYGVGSFEGLGMAGAAHATGISRALASLLGIFWLLRGYRVRLRGEGPLRAKSLVALLKIGVPTTLSIAIYSLVYFVLIRTVLRRLGGAAMAGFSIGFNGFESVSFPFFLGTAISAASLVGRNLGAEDEARARQAVRSARRVALGLGVLFALLFVGLGPILVRLYTADPAVRAEAARYLFVVGLSQLFVSVEAVNEKVLLGAGHTRAIFWVSVPGNLLRLPLAWLLALRLSLGFGGLLWAITLSSLGKAAAFHWLVERGGWRRPLAGT